MLTLSPLGRLLLILQMRIVFSTIFVSAQCLWSHCGPLSYLLSSVTKLNKFVTRVKLRTLATPFFTSGLKEKVPHLATFSRDGIQFKIVEFKFTMQTAENGNSPVIFKQGYQKQFCSSAQLWLLFGMRNQSTQCSELLFLIVRKYKLHCGLSYSCVCRILYKNEDLLTFLFIPICLIALSSKYTSLFLLASSLLVSLKLILVINVPHSSTSSSSTLHSMLFHSFSSSCVTE